MTDNKINAAIVFLSPAEVAAAHDEFRDVYRKAFALPPYSRDASVAETFADSLLRQTARAGFRCAVARETDPAQIVGFAYGYTSAPGQWWHDHVARNMPAPDVQRWLLGAFELVEFAVLPRAQGQRLGSQLHDRLLAGLTQQTAVLSTMQASTVALKMYRKRGWIILRENLFFPGGNKPYLVMGLDLASRDGRQGDASDT